MFSDKHPHRPGRISLSTSVSDFGFPQSSSAPSSPSVMPFEFDEPFPAQSPDTPVGEQNLPILKRLNRYNLLGARSGSLNDLTARVSSPLRTSFPHRTTYFEKLAQDESDSERERDKPDRRRHRMARRNGSSPSSSSDLTTPPVPMDSDAAGAPGASGIPRPHSSTSTPPRLHSSSSSMSLSDGERMPPRKVSHPVKPPRLLSLISESNPAENELKSEAQFQRMLASYNGSRIGRSKASRPHSERGRYPEEADVDDRERGDTSASDEDDDVTSTTAIGPYQQPLISSQQSTQINLNILEDAPMLESFRNSPSGSLHGMDIDLPHTYSFASSSSSSLNSTPNAWRQTPPPSTGAIRPNKRKYDDRYDPYPTTKKRAVSPSIAGLRDNLNYAMTTPIAVPVPRSPIVRNSVSMSVASSPGNGPGPPLTLGSSLSMSMSIGIPLSRPMSVVSSPIASSPQHRPVTLLASPILRPMARLAGANGIHERGQREIEGAGEGVGSLRLK